MNYVIHGRAKKNIFKSFNESILLFFFINFFIYIFSYIQKCLNIYKLNITKKTKKGNKKTRESYQNLSKEEKEKKWQYCRERYKYLLEDEKNKINWLSIEKNIIEWNIIIIIRNVIIKIRKYFNLKIIFCW